MGCNRKQMKYIDRTLPSPEENIACDEALLGLLEDAPGEDLLLFWESPRPFVVVGYSNKISSEVNLPACRQRNIPVLRRCSGGGTVVQGPGCLNYSVLLRIDRWPETQTISSTNRFVLKQHRLALDPLLNGEVEVNGHSDLTWRGLKISGNAQRRKRRHVLFHGTFLLGFDLELIDELLPLPTIRPDYRRDRPHHEFITNAPLSAEAVKVALRRIWDANEPTDLLPADRIARLVAEQYSRDEWNLKF
jgi:lipoate-protein ligase A